MIDIKSLTLGEIDRIETLSNLSIDSLGEDGTPKGKMMAAMVFVIKRREELRNGLPPRFTFADAQEMTTSEAYEVLGMNAEDLSGGPEEAPEAPAKKTRAKAPTQAPEDPTPGE